MDLSNFILKKAAFQVRYENAYLLWDHAGQIWSRVADNWPNLALAKAEPGNTSFVIDEKYELSINLNNAMIVVHTPKSDLKDLIEFSETVLSLTQEDLQVGEYSRLGFRVFFEKNYPSIEAASEAVLATGRVNLISGKHFNIEGKTSSPELNFKWEDDVKGIRASIAARKKTIEFKPSLEVTEIEATSIEKFDVDFDVDYYTLGKVSSGQLRIKDWINQAYHVIKRDHAVILGR